ncbi:hypothetical protein CERZMDRAFT_97808 [Cercospora zeae-maydis SCOH1-5]|uniref:Uncharacterized protein n=1 Tax=Cercospora zeae-maydis SCOH1-5 TaxID=717836 RepID=A0A6A6FEH4_9PEZI|nr:hypothetical protein CERZMDRAFT_97808 [Cercospora zeae-maydis SCOH1-5]
MVTSKSTFDPRSAWTQARSSIAVRIPATTTTTMAQDEPRIRGSYKEEDFWTMILAAIRKQQENGRMEKLVQTRFPAFEHKDDEKTGLELARSVSAERE